MVFITRQFVPLLQSSVLHTALVNNSESLFKGQDGAIGSEFVDTFAFGNLVVTEPFSHFLNCARVQAREVCQVLDLFFFGLIDLNRENFPVHLALINQTETAEDKVVGDTESRFLKATEVHNVNWVFVTS